MLEGFEEDMPHLEVRTHGKQRMEPNTLTNDFMFVWEELSGKTGKRLTEMLLKTNSMELSQHWSMFDRTLYVPQGNLLVFPARLFFYIEQAATVLTMAF